MQHAVKVRASVACAQSAGAETGSRNPLAFCFFFVLFPRPIINRRVCVCVGGTRGSL